MRDFSEKLSLSRNDPYAVNATACHHCREPFAPGRMRYPIFSGVNFGNGWEVVSVCMDCFKHTSADECTLADRYRRACQGCGAPMLTPVVGRFRWEVCSRRCYLRIYRKQKRLHGSTIAWKMRPENWPECEVCKRPMEGKRSDTRFCSNACRQWAHRRRRSGL